MCYGNSSNERDLLSIDPGKLPAIQERHNISPTVSRFGHFWTSRLVACTLDSLTNQPFSSRVSSLLHSIRLFCDPRESNQTNSPKKVNMNSPKPRNGSSRTAKDWTKANNPVINAVIISQAVAGRDSEFAATAFHLFKISDPPP